jgi:hypothetical protein
MSAQATIQPHRRIINSFKIGCDPEFVVLDSNYGYKHPTTGSLASGVGTDGVPVELRPDPSYTAKGLLENLGSLLNSSSMGTLREYSWRAGAVVSYRCRGIDMCSKCRVDSTIRPHKQPIGGHIHIDIPIRSGYDLSPHVNLVVVACDKVIQFLEELNIHPKEECAHRRNGIQGCYYGGFGSFHSDKKSPEGHCRLEYRTPCSWMSSRKQAFITLTAIKLASACPQLALDVLVGDSIDEKWKAFSNFIKYFVELDSDAAEAYEKFLSTGDLSLLVTPADTDIKEGWEIPCQPQQVSVSTNAL